ncbi:MAG: T9SS type A sorting domain-containing protein [Lentimicrobium sp.]|jgi:hypothetical protein|nr:T9SS type A sorting domain-containing protein [Lentimicrobium sp.]
MKKIRMNKPFAQSTLKIILCLFIIGLISGIPFNGFSQQIDREVICSSGETFVNPPFLLAFALGEIAVESFTGSTYMLTQGFLQGTINSTGINEQAIDPAKIIVFPNPATTYLYLNCQTDEAPTRIDLRDIRGQLVLSAHYLSDPTLLDITRLNAGFYMLTFCFINNQPIIKKIIKE